MKKFLAFLLTAVLLVSMSAVCAFADDAIAVDGDLADWTGEWTSVNTDNGYWQTVPTTDTLSYKYQMTADNTKLYVAVELACDAVTGGNGAGTNVRFWINSSDSATVYTHFYDVFLGASEVATGAKYNTSETTNSGAAIADSSIKAALVSNDGKTYVEFSIDLAEFNGKDGFAYYICCSNKVNENVCLYYPAVVEGDSRTANLPYSAWYRDNEGTFSKAPSTPSEPVVTVPTEAFFVTLVNPADASIPTGEDGIMYTTENTTNGWWFQVAFAPNGENWEVVELKLCDGTAATIPEGGFVWALHDTATTTPVTCAFIQGMQVGEVYRIKGLDVANGTVEENAKIKLYVEGDEWPADEEVDDEDESKTPEAGDTSSMIVFAIIALVAIAGSAVVIKSRN